MNTIQQVEVTSESDFCSRAPSPDTSVLSITNYRAMPHPHEGWANFLSLHFNDIDDTMLTWHKKLICAIDDLVAPVVGEHLNKLLYGRNPWCNRPFSRGDARQVIEWVRTVHSQKLIIHCEFGRSRSVAVAKCLSKAGHFDSAHVEFLIDGIRPNKRVTRILSREISQSSHKSTIP